MVQLCFISDALVNICVCICMYAYLAGFVSNHVSISLLESLCDDCKDNTKDEKCLHCDLVLCTSCVQNHLEIWTTDAKKSMCTLEKNIECFAVVPQTTDALVQSVQDRCHDMREEVMRAMAKQLRDIDSSQQAKIKELFTQSDLKRVAVQTWRDQLDPIKREVSNTRLTAQQLVHVTRDLKGLSDEVESSDKGRSGETPHIRGASMIRGMSSTLVSYRNMTSSKYILSCVSSEVASGKYQHVSVSPVDGKIYVADKGGSVLRISDTGRDVSNFKMAEYPRGVVVNGDGNIIITSSMFSIQYFKPDGTLIDTVGDYGTATGNFHHPYGVACGTNKELFVADYTNKRVQVMQPDKKWQIHSVYSQTPIGVAVCPDGTVLVSTRDNSELWKIDNDGSKSRIHLSDSEVRRTNGMGYGQLAIDRNGYILLVDRGNHCVLVLDIRGQIHCKIGEKGSLPGQFNEPTGIAVTENGRIVVTEFDKRIEIF